MLVLNEMLAVVLDDLASEDICEPDQKLKNYQSLLHYLCVLSHF